MLERTIPLGRGGTADEAVGAAPVLHPRIGRCEWPDAHVQWWYRRDIGVIRRGEFVVRPSASGGDGLACALGRTFIRCETGTLFGTPKPAPSGTPVREPDRNSRKFNGRGDRI